MRDVVLSIASGGWRVPLFQSIPFSIFNWRTIQRLYPILVVNRKQKRQNTIEYSRGMQKLNPDIIYMSGFMETVLI